MGSETPEWTIAHLEVMLTVPGLVLAFFEATVLASLSVAISTRLPMMANFVICFSIYVLGHITPLAGPVVDPIRSGRVHRPVYRHDPARAGPFQYPGRRRRRATGPLHLPRLVVHLLLCLQRNRHVVGLDPVRGSRPGIASQGASMGGKSLPRAASDCEPLCKRLPIPDDRGRQSLPSCRHCLEPDKLRKVCPYCRS